MHSDLVVFHTYFWFLNFFFPKDFASCREILLRRGEDFVSSMQESRKKILRSSHNLIKDGMVILTHSKSRNVLAVMAEAARQGRQFKVFVTESQPDCSG